jgi:hypothetical protein
LEERLIDRNWSVIVRAFSGDWKEFRHAAHTLFGRSGLDAWSLLNRADTLPAEIAGELSSDEAWRIVEALIKLGATAEAVESVSIGDVRYRADEVWATRPTDRHDFIEIDGMIFAGYAINVRRNLAVLRRREGVANWQHERALNHIYADASYTELTPRDRIREEVKLAAIYEDTLTTVYPEKPFVISHRVGDGVTFYQPIGDAPRTDSPPRHRPEKKLWCENCHLQQAFTPRTISDPEFPKAEWGDCDVCGQEVLVAGWQVLKCIVPDCSFCWDG